MFSIPSPKVLVFSSLVCQVVRLFKQSSLFDILETIFNIQEKIVPKEKKKEKEQ